MARTSAPTETVTATVTVTATADLAVAMLRGAGGERQPAARTTH